MSNINDGSLVNRLAVVCGANTTQLQNVRGKTVRNIARMTREVLNITSDHEVFLDGKRVVNPDEYVLNGDEKTLEFKKDSGQKGN